MRSRPGQEAEALIRLQVAPALGRQAARRRRQDLLACHPRHERRSLRGGPAPSLTEVDPAREYWDACSLGLGSSPGMRRYLACQRRAPRFARASERRRTHVGCSLRTTTERIDGRSGHAPSRWRMRLRRCRRPSRLEIVRRERLELDDRRARSHAMAVANVACCGARRLRLVEEEQHAGWLPLVLLRPLPEVPRVTRWRRTVRSARARSTTHRLRWRARAFPAPAVRAARPLRRPRSP